MNKGLILLLMLMLGMCSLATVGCTGEEHDKAGEEHDSAGGEHDGHDADGEIHVHDGHGHDEDGDTHGGAEHVLGKLSVNGFELTIHQLGVVAAGGEAALEIEVLSGGAPEAVRVWIGDEQAKGAAKGLADKKTSGAFHAHAEVMAELAADAKIWVEVENAAGTRAAGSIAFVRE